MTNAKTIAAVTRAQKAHAAALEKVAATQTALSSAINDLLAEEKSAAQQKSSPSAKSATSDKKSQAAKSTAGEKKKSAKSAVKASKKAGSKKSKPVVAA